MSLTSCGQERDFGTWWCTPEKRSDIRLQAWKITQAGKSEASAVLGCALLHPMGWAWLETCRCENQTQVVTQKPAAQAAASFHSQPAVTGRSCDSQVLKLFGSPVLQEVEAIIYTTSSEIHIPEGLMNFFLMFEWRSLTVYWKTLFGLFIMTRGRHLT